MISNKCYYALKALLELSLREGQGPVSIAELAKAQQIPPRFLEAILRQLKQAGFTESVRGKEGGYLLNLPSNQISLGRVIEVFEGPLVAVNAVVEEPGHSPFPEVWAQAEAALAGVYQSKNFQELAARSRALKGGFLPDYSI